MSDQRTGTGTPSDATLPAGDTSGAARRAANGRPSHLTDAEHARAVSPEFKAEYGDWEKPARIDKLRAAQSLTATGEEWSGKYELNARAAQKYIMDNLRGRYRVSDTGDQIQVTRNSAGEVLSHNRFDETHLKSIALIPQLIEHGTFIAEIPNEKGHQRFDSYRYYITGLRMGGEDYTAKIVVGVKNGKMLYDHDLTRIEKGNLIDGINLISSKDATNQTALSNLKDKRLLGLLNKNLDKIFIPLDANGESKMSEVTADADLNQPRPDEGMRSTC